MTNHTHPILPDYTGPTEGWFTFLHHDQVIEYSRNVLERRDYVLREKPGHEQTVRAQACQVVPPDQITPALITALVAYNQARVAYNQALAAYNQTWLQRTFPDTDWAALYDEVVHSLRFPTDGGQP